MINRGYKYVFLVIPLVCFVACSGGAQQVNDKGAMAQKLSLEEIKFKEWLKDTLVVFAGAAVNKIPNGTMTYKVRNDSLQFDVYTKYQFTYDRDYKQKDDEIGGMISLLKEYKEMPGLNSKISFTVHFSYYPSSIEQLRAAFVEEVEDILVDKDDELIEYGYIRGRLGDKVIKDKKTGAEKGYYKFIWHSDSLIKEKM